MTVKRTAQNQERIDLFLRKIIPEELQKTEEISNSKIRRLIIAGSVFVNESQCRVPSYIIRKGDEVKVNVDEQKFFYEKQPDDIKFEVTAQSVLYEDDSIIVVDKPAFFPTEETITGSRDNLHEAVIRYLWSKNPALRNPPYVGIMHRLDRETSGVILFTKTRTVNAAVHDMFENHIARKVYRAVCTKNINAKELQKEFSVDNFIGRVSASSAACKMGVVKGSAANVKNKNVPLHAHTDFTLVAKKNDLYFIEARPATGRTHQIRVHLSSIGYPLLGDELYGGKNSGRIMLHALSLTFPHPLTGKIMTVTSELPKDFLAD